MSPCITLHLFAVHNPFAYLANNRQLSCSNLPTPALVTCPWVPNQQVSCHIPHILISPAICRKALNPPPIPLWPLKLTPWMTILHPPSLPTPVLSSGTCKPPHLLRLLILFLHYIISLVFVIPGNPILLISLQLLALSTNTVAPSSNGRL